MASPLGEITLSLLLMLLTASVCAGREFIVASGRNGWTWTVPDKPLQDFLINDTLVFSYDKNVDAVLRVRDSQYTACNTTDPLIRLNGGKSRLVLESLGYYYFISADALRCQVGERLIVFVNPAPKNTPSAHPPPPPKPLSTTPSSSSAVDLRAGVVACLIGASAATSMAARAFARLDLLLGMKTGRENPVPSGSRSRFSPDRFRISRINT
ncbi:hypothetical protein EJB05_32492, partial [Eragrostis curvula]